MYFKKINNKTIKISNTVNKHLLKEKNFGINKLQTYQIFANKVLRTRKIPISNWNKDVRLLHHTTKPMKSNVLVSILLSFNSSSPRDLEREKRFSLSPQPDET